MSRQCAGQTRASEDRAHWVKRHWYELGGLPIGRAYYSGVLDQQVDTISSTFRLYLEVGPLVGD